ncbi:hypothetical protein SEA_FLATHEAD_39 [Mycobacterium phage Flathead]|nr:hypothetical protein SEA_FLATHEAD_39 [Mycobacterium phage Flathead]
MWRRASEVSAYTVASLITHESWLDTRSPLGQITVNGRTPAETENLIDRVREALAGRGYSVRRSAQRPILIIKK